MAAAAAVAHDTTLLVNNAGVPVVGPITSGGLDAMRRGLDTHLRGSLNMVRAFSPVLARNGGGAIANVLSAMSWSTTPEAGGYHVAKAAEWAMTNALRVELAGEGTLVTAVHLGAADTEFTADYDGLKITAAHAAAALVDGIAAGSSEVLVDDWSRAVKAALADDATAFALGALARM